MPPEGSEAPAEDEIAVLRRWQEVTARHAERMAGLIGVRESALHDPCAVLAVTHPQLLDFQLRAVSVELQGALTRGMTVVDQRVLRRSGGRSEPENVEVAYELDADRAMALILRAIESGDAP